MIRYAIILFLISTSLHASRLTIKSSDGDFEQEFRIVEQEGIWRIDASDKYWTILYFSAEGKYIGLEHRDAAFWEFRWEDVQKEIQYSKAHHRRFSDLNIEGFASYDLTRPDEAPQVEPWNLNSLGQSRKWNGLTTHFWDLTQKGRSPLKMESVSLLSLQNLISKFKVIHQQIRQAVVRPLWSESLDEATSLLVEKGESPIDIRWGDEKNPYLWKIEKWEEKSNEPHSSFEVPKKYRPTTVESLRGILKELQP